MSTERLMMDPNKLYDTGDKIQNAGKTMTSAGCALMLLPVIAFFAFVILYAIWEILKAVFT